MRKGCSDSVQLEDMLDILQAVGLTDVFNQLYVTSQPLPYLALLTFLFTVSSLEKFSFEKDLGEPIFSVLKFIEKPTIIVRTVPLSFILTYLNTYGK